MTTKTTDLRREQFLSAPAGCAPAGGLSHLGYVFPANVVGNKFFQEFIMGFKKSGAESFTQLQCSMLDELVRGRAFQVTSPDVSCGSGKTSLTVAATIGMFQENDKIIFVNKPGRGESSLTKELKQLVEKFSGGPSKMSVATVLNETDAQRFVSVSDVIITNCIALEDVLEEVIKGYTLQDDRNLSETCKISTVHLVFDEAHKIFNHENLGKMADWTIEQEKKNSAEPYFCVNDSLPTLQYLSKSLCQLHAASKTCKRFKALPIFLSAVGDFNASKLQKDAAAVEKLSSSEVVEMCIGQWMETPVKKLINTGNNSERNYNKIFKIHREGAIQIGGMDSLGYVMVYEAMMNIAFNNLIKGRMLFIVRRQQVEAFSNILDKKIEECGSFFSYTADRDYWNAVDETTYEPLYNIVIVREDELDDLEGVNIDGLRAVYLFSLGHTKNLYQKMQGLGRVGRLGQEASYCFVMIDCATKKNGAIEAESSPFLLEAMSSNGTCRPHIIEVKGAKALNVPSNIPTFVPQSDPPTPVHLQEIKKMIKKANRPQVCKFMRYSHKTGTYECPSLERGYRCAWYHPKPLDFAAAKSTALKCCTFNTSYCKKGVFRETRCCCINSMVRISPLTDSTVAWKSENPKPSSVMASQFPALGDEKCSGSHNLETETATPVRDPRLERPVCRFAAMDMYKCKTRRQGKLCYFRHPEEAEDRVTEEEYLQALELSIQNLNKSKIKYGQKPITFSKDLYSKYNYPGRYKSNLVKASASVTLKSPSKPVQSLEAVLKSESSPESGSSQLFDALQSAYAKKSTRSDKPRTSSTNSKPDNNLEEDVKDITSVVSCCQNVESGDSIVDISFGDFTTVSSKRTSVKKSELKSGDQGTLPHSKSNIFHLLQLEDEEKESDTETDEENDVARTDDGDMVCQTDQNIATSTIPEPDLKAELCQSQNAAADDIVAKNILGSDLVVHFQSNGKYASEAAVSVTTAAAIVTSFLRDQSACSLNYRLFDDAQYGLGMKYLLQQPSLISDRIAAQTDVLDAIEAYCFSQDFAKVNIKTGKKSIIDVLFRLVYAYDLVEEEAFFAWHEMCEYGDLAREEVKLKAVQKTTEFYSWLLQDDGCDTEEEYSSEPTTESSNFDLDNRTATIVHNPVESEVEVSEQNLTKAERKALKQLRRQEKVASRGSDESSKLSQQQSSLSQ